MNRTRYLGFALFAPFALAAACAPGALSQDRPDGAAEAAEAAEAAVAERAEDLSCGDLATVGQHALRFADRALSAASEHLGVEGLLAGFEDDAVYLTEGQPILYGKAAIRAELLAHPPAGALRWQPTRVDVGAVPDVGYTIDQEQIGAVGPDGAPQGYGKHVAFWRFGKQGWRIAAWLASPSGGPPTTPPAWFTTPPVHGPACPALVDPAAAAEQMLQADADFAALSLTAGVAYAFYSNYADHYLGVPPGADFRYRDKSPVAPPPAPPGPGDVVLEWTPTLAGAGRSGDLGFTVGDSTTYYTDENGAPGVDYGKYLTVWQRQPDGSLKYFVDGGNSRPAPSP